MTSLKYKYFGLFLEPLFGRLGLHLDEIHPQIQNPKMKAASTNFWNEMKKEDITCKNTADHEEKYDSVTILLNKNNNSNANNDVSFTSGECSLGTPSEIAGSVNSYYDNVEALMSDIGTSKNIDGIYNLSDYNLSDSERSLLNKGLKFCPTPPLADIGSLVRDSEKFFRSAAIKLHFHNISSKEDSTVNDQNVDTNSQSSNSQPGSTQNAFSHPDLKPKSKWNAPVPPLLEHVKQLFLTDIQSTKLKPTRNKNLSAQEFKSLLTLPKNKNIVIKQADKGSGIVIQNIDDYIKEGERQLNDERFYKPMNQDLTNKHAELIKKVASEMLDQEQITDKTYKYLTTNCTRTPQFYMLPKIHKSLTNPPGRPIISGNDSPTEKISHMLDVILQPFVPQVKSYVKDTTDFIQKLSNLEFDPEMDIILVTLDVTSLYTNIPHDEGIQAIKTLLQRERPSSYKPSNGYILKLLEMVLTMNNFQFNHKNYLQTNGTAMGTRVAPTYANLYMSDFENKHVYTYHKQPLFWLRYIDDVFMPWQHGLDELQKFVTHLNSVSEHITFTIEWSRQKVPFLDTTVLYSPLRGFYTDLYTKPTDTHSYLRYSSCHPPHVMSGLPYSQFLRLRRICNNITDFYVHALSMARDFCDRGYPQLRIWKAIDNVLKLDRISLLAEAKSNTDAKSEDGINLYFITEYNPSNPPIRDLLERHWPILGRSSSTRPLISANIIYGNRRPRNLKDSLMNAKLPLGPDMILKESPSCKSGYRCNHCPKIDRTGFIYSNTTKRKFKCLYNGCCQSRNLIYCITCLHCGSQYVGQTKTTLMTRINNHKSTIRTGKDVPLANHMKSHDDIVDPKIRIHVLQFIKHEPDSIEAKESRDQAERDWMARLNSLVPNGMNLQE